MIKETVQNELTTDEVFRAIISPDHQDPKLISYAKRYLEVGWKIVPLLNNEKFYKGDWRKFLTTPIKIEELKQMNNLTGLAVITGKESNLTVIDDDWYAKGNKLPLESTLESQTTSGGRHLFFKFSNIGNANVRSENNDYEIQESHKLIVLPPTKAKNKKGSVGQYKWLKNGLSQLRTISKYELPAFKEKGEKVNLDELVEVSEGDRHNSFLSLCNSEFSIKPRQKWAATAKMLKANALVNYNPPMGEDEIDRIIKDAMSFIAKNEKHEIKEQDEDLNSRFITFDQISDECDVYNKLAKIAPSSGYRNLDKAIGGFIAGDTYVLSGLTNVGKTQIASNFAVNLVRQHKRVLYFALEPKERISNYIYSIYLGRQWLDYTLEEKERAKNEIKKYLTIIKKCYNIDEFVALVKMSKPDLVILDHVGYFEENKSSNPYQDQGSRIRKIVDVAHEVKAAIICTAHLRKTQREPTVDDISGSAAFKQDAENVLIAVRQENDDKDALSSFSDFGYIGVWKCKATGFKGRVPINFSFNSPEIKEPISGLPNFDEREK